MGVGFRFWWLGGPGMLSRYGRWQSRNWGQTWCGCRDEFNCVNFKRHICTNYSLQSQLCLSVTGNSNRTKKVKKKAMTILIWILVVVKSRVRDWDSNLSSVFFTTTHLCIVPYLFYSSWPKFPNNGKHSCWRFCNLCKCPL